MKNTIFDDLFLSKEEEQIYKMKELEREFILSENDMLFHLKSIAYMKVIEAKQAIKAFKDYEQHIRR